MMLWLPIIILAYLFFSISFFGDKLGLSGPPKAPSYTFYVSLLGLLSLVLIPFTQFRIPDAISFCWIICEAIVYTLGIYTMFRAIEKFEVSRVMVTIGALQPLIIFFVTGVIFGSHAVSGIYLVAFIILLIGSIIISFEKSIAVTGQYLKITLISSLLFSLDYIFSKLVFLHQPFLAGLIWMRVWSFLLVVPFLLNKDFRKGIRGAKSVFHKKTSFTFLGSQLAGGIAGLLQNFAIFLSPVGFLPLLNALRGIQYVFLFLITLFFSLFFPHILKENISKKVMAQKIFSIILIIIGLAILISY